MSADQLHAELRDRADALGRVRACHKPGECDWLCPVCLRDGREGLLLPVDPARPGGPVRCNRGCSDDAIFSALGIDGSNNSAARDRERTSLRSRGRTSLPLDDNDDLPLSGALHGSSTLTAEQIGHLGRHEEPVRRATATLGIAEPFRNSRCVVPGHGGSGCVFQDTYIGIFKYACLCDRDNPTYWTLAELRAANAEKRTEQRRLSNLLAAVWYLRLWHEAGLIEPLHIDLPAMAGGAVAADVLAVHDGFALLLGLRWLLYPGQPVAYGRTFAGPWCGVSIPAAYHAITAMRKQAVIVQHKIQRRTPLYLPGGIPR